MFFTTGKYTVTTDMLDLIAWEVEGPVEGDQPNRRGWELALNLSDLAAMLFEVVISGLRYFISTANNTIRTEFGGRRKKCVGRRYRRELTYPQ